MYGFDDYHDSFDFHESYAKELVNLNGYNKATGSIAYESIVGNQEAAVSGKDWNSIDIFVDRIGRTFEVDTNNEYLRLVANELVKLGYKQVSGKVGTVNSDYKRAYTAIDYIYKHSKTPPVHNPEFRFVSDGHESYIVRQHEVLATLQIYPDSHDNWSFVKSNLYSYIMSIYVGLQKKPQVLSFAFDPDFDDLY